MKQRTPLIVCIGLLVGVLVTSVARAQDNKASPSPPATPSQTALASPQPTPPQTAASPQPTPPPPRVTKVIEGHLELDDLIQIEIDHFSEWAATNNATKLVPYLNGRAVHGNYPEEIHASKNHLLFHLQISPENKDVWVDLLGAPAGTTRPVAFSVGLEDKAPFDSVFDQSSKLPLTVISPMYGVVALLVVLFTLILFTWLARTTNLIRERGPNLSGKRLRPYNLGRTQMAFWFFLIYVSYIVIWLVTGALDTITPSLLGLLGISAGTALSEALIDSGKDTVRANQLQELTAEKESLDQSVGEVQSQIAAASATPGSTPEDIANRDSLNKQLQDNRLRLAQINQQLQAFTPTPSEGASMGFLRDILSDATGYSFHRFQIFAWTIVLGIMFVSSVYNNLSMPAFSATLLGLMGISSGTYIGFKFPEKK